MRQDEQENERKISYFLIKMNIPWQKLIPFSVLVVAINAAHLIILLEVTEREERERGKQKVCNFLLLWFLHFCGKLNWKIVEEETKETRWQNDWTNEWKNWHTWHGSDVFLQDFHWYHHHHPQPHYDIKFNLKYKFYTKHKVNFQWRVKKSTTARVCGCVCVRN